MISVLFQPTKNAFVLLTFCFQNEEEKKIELYNTVCAKEENTLQQRQP
jgi:hypothetical protein